MSYLLGPIPCDPKGSVLCWSKALLAEGKLLFGRSQPLLSFKSCPGAAQCFPSPHRRASCGCRVSPALSTSEWMGAALILCMAGWTGLLQHPSCSSSPRQLSSLLLCSYALGSLFPSTWDFSAHFTLCPNTVPLAAPGYGSGSCSRRKGAAALTMPASGWLFSSQGADAAHSPGIKAIDCCWIKELSIKDH